MSKVNLDILLGADVFTDEQKKEINNNLVSYTLNTDRHNPKTVMVDVEIRELNVKMNLYFKKKDSEDVYDSLYKHLAYLIVCVRSSKMEMKKLLKLLRY